MSLKRVTASVAAAFTNEDSDEDGVAALDHGSRLTISTAMRAHMKQSRAAPRTAQVQAHHPLPVGVTPITLKDISTDHAAPPPPSRLKRSRFSDRPPSPKVELPKTVIATIGEQPKKRRRFCEHPNAPGPPSASAELDSEERPTPAPPPPVDEDPSADDEAAFAAIVKARAIAAAAIARLDLPSGNALDDDGVPVNSEGTWEHRVRAYEIAHQPSNATMENGGHHVTDFVHNAEEDAKFVQMISRQMKGEAAGISSSPSTAGESSQGQYANNRLQGDNKGYAMLEKMGWKSDKGLGLQGQGIVTPVGSGRQSGDRVGLGAQQAAEGEEETDVFAAYRNRLKTAYKNRPNPFNNPRRSYY